MTEFLMWSSIHTRLDLSYLVEILSRYAFNSNKMHCNLLKRILRYVIDTIDFDIIFSKNVESEVDLIAYSDSNFADLKNKRHFISEYVMMLINESILHASRKQVTIILSSCEIEYMIMTESVKKVIWCVRFLIELSFREYNILVILHVDNRDVIDLTINSQFYKRTKHIEIRWHWIREVIERKLIKINFLFIKKMLTNDLIKSLTESTFDAFRKLLNMKIWIAMTTISISTICLDERVLEYSRHN
jgi:hypothetical protein